MKQTAINKQSAVFKEARFKAGPCTAKGAIAAVAPRPNPLLHGERAEAARHCMVKLPVTVPPADSVIENEPASDGLIRVSVSDALEALRSA